MRKAFRFILLFSLILNSLFTSVHAQEVGIGQWREHLSYRNAHTLTEGDNKIFCASQSGIFSLNKSDNSIERLSKVVGLSDIGASTMNFNNYNKALLIAYADANIDIVQEKSVVNLSDIKRKTSIGNKTINNIFFIDQFAYLACGFGIVIIDTDRKEIKDTYYIGPNGSAINVYDITSDHTNLYAATEKGVYTAPLNAPNLANFNSWTKIPGLPNGIFNTLAYLNGNLYMNFSSYLTFNQNNNDTLYIYNGSSWTKKTGGYLIEHVRAMNNTLVISYPFSVDLVNNGFTPIKSISKYGFADVRNSDAIVDASGITWIADTDNGLVKVFDQGNAQSIFPSGPVSSNVISMDIQNNKLVIVPGGVIGSWGNSYNIDGISFNYNNNWSYIRGQQSFLKMDTLYDFLAVAVDPKNKDHVYAGSWIGGVLEFYNDTIYKVWKETNSSLAQVPGDPSYYSVRIGGLTFDKDNNLWVSNSNCTRTLSVRKADGSWKGFDFAAIGINKDITVSSVIATKSKQKWVILPRGTGVLVYNDDGTMPAPTILNSKKLNATVGNGGLPSSGVYSIAEDQNGEIWVGTDKGIGVFYSPENIFTQTSGWDAQQILLEQDGHVQQLLITEVVSAIAVDDANRKWIGTQKSGVFLMSADGTKQVFHFTAENSPLLSNNITSISINHKTGEVYFGTDRGLISYKGSATEGLDAFTDVLAYPNPVRPEYKGLIAIKGLVKNASVKITDIAGNLVYSTKAEGGQATWTGNNFEGERAHTGVYLVFCSNDDGTQTFVTKILFIN